MQQGECYDVLGGGVVGVRFWLLTSSAWVGVVCCMWCAVGSSRICNVVVGMFVFVHGCGVLGITPRFAVCRTN